MGQEAAPPTTLRTPDLPASAMSWTLLGFACVALWFAASGRVIPFARVPVDSAFLALAAIAAVLGWGRELYPQNILTVAIGFWAVTAGVHFANSASGIPFGSIQFTAGTGSKWGWLLLSPLFWTTCLLSSRLASRWLLRNQKSARFYGYYVVGLSTCLCVVGKFQFERLAIQRGYWSRPGTEPDATLPCSFQELAAWTAVSLLLLVSSTPWFAKKRPGATESWHGLIICLAFLVYAASLKVAF